MPYNQFCVFMVCLYHFNIKIDFRAILDPFKTILEQHYNITKTIPEYHIIIEQMFRIKKAGQFPYIFRVKNLLFFMFLWQLSQSRESCKVAPKLQSCSKVAKSRKSFTPPKL